MWHSWNTTRSCKRYVSVMSQLCLLTCPCLSGRCLCQRKTKTFKPSTLFFYIYSHAPPYITFLYTPTLSPLLQYCPFFHHSSCNTSTILPHSYYINEGMKSMCFCFSETRFPIFHLPSAIRPDLIIISFAIIHTLF